MRYTVTVEITLPAESPDDAGARALRLVDDCGGVAVVDVVEIEKEPEWTPR